MISQPTSEESRADDEQIVNLLAVRSDTRTAPASPRASWVVTNTSALSGPGVNPRGIVTTAAPWSRVATPSSTACIPAMNPVAAHAPHPCPAVVSRRPWQTGQMSAKRLPDLRLRKLLEVHPERDLPGGGERPLADDDGGFAFPEHELPPRERIGEVVPAELPVPARDGGRAILPRYGVGLAAEQGHDVGGDPGGEALPGGPPHGPAVARAGLQ